MKILALAILASLPVLACAQTSDAQLVLQDTRVFSCDDPNGGDAKCLDQSRFPVKGEMVLRVGSGVCEKHTYSVAGGDVYRNGEGVSQIQFPASVDQTVSFHCDALGNPI
jgi:hypothetical protein